MDPSWEIEPNILCGLLLTKQTQRIHVWYIYLHLPYKSAKNVGKYTIHGSYGRESGAFLSNEFSEKARPSGQPRCLEKISVSSATLLGLGGGFKHFLF